MKSVIDSKKEFRKVLIGGGVILAVLVGILVVVKLGGAVNDSIVNRPAKIEPMAFPVLPLDRTVVGKFVVAQGFSASPDDILGEGEESVYRWGEKGGLARFLEISFKEGYIDYEAVWQTKITTDISRVAEIKYAERLAWDFLQVADLWDKRLVVKPETKLFYRESNGTESSVAGFDNANLFRVYFRATAGEAPYQYPVLAPSFETYLAKVDVFGPTGQILAAKIYPLFLGEGKPPLSSLEKVAVLENPRRPEEGFLPQGQVVYVPVKGDYMRLWEAKEASAKQVFKGLD